MLAKSTLQQLGQREEEVARTMSYPMKWKWAAKREEYCYHFKKEKTSRAMLFKFWPSARIRSRKSKAEEKGQLPTSPALQCLTCTAH